jgi:WD40 repeat protein
MIQVKPQYSPRINISSQPYPTPELRILTQAYPHPEQTPQLPQVNTQYFPKCPFDASNVNSYSDEYHDDLIQYTLSTPRKITTPDYSLESLQWLPDGNHLLLWPYFTRWSPDNRYLAILSTTGTGILPFIKILILDTQTGQLLGINPTYPEFSNAFFTDIAWSPESQTIASLVGQGDNLGNNLVFIDVATGFIEQVSPDNSFFQSGVAGNIDWSSSGENIAGVCSDGSICIIDIIHQ